MATLLWSVARGRAPSSSQAARSGEPDSHADLPVADRPWGAAARAGFSAASYRAPAAAAACPAARAALFRGSSLYDVMHNCGCYYQVFPSPHLQLRNDLPSTYFEKPLQPQAAPDGRPLVIRIAHANHYIQRIYRADITENPSLLAWRNYDTLRAMPALNSTRSLFGEYGIIEASKRPERYLLWPTGVRSPGAMRQWGQHAIGFDGHRHFDDAHLLDTLFEKTSSP